MGQRAFETEGGGENERGEGGLRRGGEIRGDRARAEAKERSGEQSLAIRKAPALPSGVSMGGWRARDCGYVVMGEGLGVQVQGRQRDGSQRSPPRRTSSPPCSTGSSEGDRRKKKKKRSARASAAGRRGSVSCFVRRSRREGDRTRGGRTHREGQVDKQVVRGFIMEAGTKGQPFGSGAEAAAAESKVGWPERAHESGASPGGALRRPLGGKGQGFDRA